MKILLILLLTISTYAVNIQDYGAVPNDGLSDCSAIRSAIGQIYLQQGGKVKIPDGTYDWDCQVSASFGGIANKINFTIEGSAGTIIKVHTPGLVTLFTGNHGTTRIKDLVFVPKTKDLWNTRQLFYATTTNQVMLDNVQIYGIGASEHLVNTYHGDTQITNSQFMSNVAGESLVRAGIQALTVRNVFILDWGQHAGVHYNKVPSYHTPVAIEWDASSPYFNAIGNRSVRFENVRIDEGYQTAISVRNAYSARFQDININLGGTTGDTGIYLENVNDATIDFMALHWKNGTSVKAVNSHVEARAVIKKKGLAITEDIDSNSSYVCEKCGEFN